MVHVSLTTKLQKAEPDHQPITAETSIGYCILFASLAAFGLTEYLDVKKDMFTIFWVHYICSIAYTAFLIHADAYGLRKSWRRENIHLTAIAVNIYLVSAFALNRELHVFSDSVSWLCYYLLITSAVLLSFRFFNKLPLWVNALQFLALGSAAIFYVYLACYVAPFYVVGTVGLIMLGIGIHIFVPVVLVVTTIFLFVHHGRKHARYWLAAGAVITVIFVTVFVQVWNSRIERIETVANQYVMNPDLELPIWVTLAQELKNDWITSRILKSDLVYNTGKEFWGSGGFNFRGVSWGEEKKHDPLVFISTLSKRCSLSEEDRVRILKVLFRGRHMANERLWSGENLTTSYVVSDVDIYPALRLAYTEKYVNVRNSASNNWSRNTEEAIYTFYMPEGSVVTSLSLWIEGKEEKGILTSKQKAQNAYETIVGVERRDPSVVHWQEGNTVTVRVFPCTPDEERKFKIGITSPLQESNGITTYRNIVFDGPDGENARETKRIRFIGSVKGLDLDGSFTKDKKGDFVSEQDYDPRFTLNFETSPIPANRFTFDGSRYSLSSYEPELVPASVKQIYLDINTSWTDEEIDELEVLRKRFDLYVFAEEELIKLDGQNWDVTKDLQRRNFTVFPFHHVKDPANTLVVTKGEIFSPHLSDFSKSKFADATSAFFSSGKKINVFSLNGGASTYVRSLRELRAFEFASGSAMDLIAMLDSRKLPYTSESDNRIVLHDSGLVISKQETKGDSSTDNAPDHLARLFAYNDIMRKAGPNYLNHDFINDDLVGEAARAYVVSPVSSLIVLESQKDYERFGIEDTSNSLQNAVRQSSGAVPEPHEWALIILFALLIVYMRFRSVQVKRSFL